MRWIVLGAHLRRDDIEPVAEALAAREIFFSGVPVADEQPLGDRELLLRVAKTRAALLERATFIAVRYGFAVWSANEAAAKTAPQLERWRELLERHRQHVEMTLKVVASGTARRPDRKDFTSGADYLRALHAAASSVDVSEAFKRAVIETLQPIAHRWLHRDEKSLECAMLVARGAAPDAEPLRRYDVPFLLSGPWPLEVFADADRE
jgi:hypothetical protein